MVTNIFVCWHGDCFSYEQEIRIKNSVREEVIQDAQKLLNWGPGFWSDRPEACHFAEWPPLQAGNPVYQGWEKCSLRLRWGHSVDGSQEGADDWLDLNGSSTPFFDNWIPVTPHMMGVQMLPAVAWIQANGWRDGGEITTSRESVVNGERKQTPWGGDETAPPATAGWRGP